MAVTQRLDLRQSQSLVMTPQLQQAIKLLQLSNLEVAAYVEQELEQNPLLERDEGGDGGPTNATEREQALGAAGEAVAEHQAWDNDAHDSAELTAADHLPAGGDMPLDTDYDTFYDNADSDRWPGDTASGDSWSDRPSGRGAAPDATGDGSSAAERVSERATLRQHLLEQIQYDLRDAADRLIATHLVELLDENGYLNADLAELAATLGCGPERVAATLALVQRFDPPGIFARDLRECLALQLADRDRLDPAMASLLDNLPLLGRGDRAKLRELCGVDEEDLADMIAEIRALNPKPAEAYDFEPAEPIVPDILMRRGPKGDWIIDLNSETLPRVLVNERYHAVIAKRARSRTEKDYISERFQTANWLVKALHQRATTILKVAGEIVRQQDAFFRKGVQHLRPLTLRDIAEAIEMHESTVSRVTSRKYIATPRGIFELKYFFTAALGGVNGETHSAEAVRHRIRALINAEAAPQVLSDDRIVEILRGDGIEIARRTVAKYREAMHIPSSVERRRQKALHP